MGNDLREPLEINADNDLNKNKKRLIVASLLSWCLCSLLSCVSFDSSKASFVIYGAAILILLFDAGFLKIAQRKTGKDLKKTLLLTLILSGAISFLIDVIIGVSYIGIPGSAGFVFSKRRWMLMTIFMFPVLSLAVGYYLNSTCSLIEKIKRSVLTHCSIAVLFSFLSYFLCKAIIGSSSSSSFRLAYLITSVFAILLVLAFLKLKMEAGLHIVFIYIVVLLGSFLVFALPHVTAISPDDQIHFARSLGLSFLGYGYVSYADCLFSVVPWVDNSIVDFAHIEDIVAYLNNATYSDVMPSSSFENPIDHSSLSFVAMVGYIPSAIGLMAGKALGLKATYYLLLGKLCNLFFYAAIAATAIRVLPSGKILAFIVGILPTNIYLASNYSYDPWVTSLIMLGLALVLREKFAVNKKFELSSATLIATVFLAALSPKAIYFPLVLSMLLVPRAKFNSKGNYRSYVCFTCFVIMLAIMSFIVPMFGSSTGMEGDARGGQDVSASGQIAFILSHPLYSIGVIASYVAWYISPIASDGFTLNYTYMGNLQAYLPFIAAVPYVLIAAFGFSGEKRESAQLCVIERMGILLLSFASIFLVALALYVSFTPVGFNWVNGCQTRYLEPLLFPVLMGLFWNRAHANAAEGFLMGVLIILSILMDYYCVVEWSFTSILL